MHKARAFFYVCAGLLCLALAYHLGARSATAQVGSSNPVVAAFLNNGDSRAQWAYTANGDVYASGDAGRTWIHLGNVFSAPTSAAQPTWGQLKARYRQPAAPQDK